jgi:hypothetical protein
MKNLLNKIICTAHLRTDSRGTATGGEVFWGTVQVLVPGPAVRALGSPQNGGGYHQQAKGGEEKEGAREGKRACPCLRESEPPVSRENAPPTALWAPKPQIPRLPRDLPHCHRGGGASAVPPPGDPTVTPLIQRAGRRRCWKDLKRRQMSTSATSWY